MPRKRDVDLPGTTVFATSTGERFFPVTEWMPATDVRKLKFVLDVREIVGDAQVAGGYQTADVESSPGGGSSVGVFRSTTGVEFPGGLTDISGSTAGKQLVRLGFVCKNAAQNANNLLFVIGRVEVWDG